MAWILIEGWPVATTADMLGVSRATAYKWLRRYRAEGLAGLEDRSARPRRRPRALAEHEVRRILRLRRRLRVGPHRLGPLLGHPRSTIYGVLRRHGVSRLAHADRLTGAPLRYVRERPGELIHVDVKKLGRVPDGGGHRMLGLVPGVSAGWATTTCMSRSTMRRGWPSSVSTATSAPRPRCASCAMRARFFADHGVRIERVMTDNAMTYTQSRILVATFAELGIRHLRTRPRRPQTNGASEFGRLFAMVRGFGAAGGWLRLTVPHPVV
ncbi:MAG: helix-turn-helix domain-containing protein [Chloroflexi bacterium]|nr:helix-turn-helix domain-containing protein [Chloroflexota bacterium]